MTSKDTATGRCSTAELINQERYTAILHRYWKNWFCQPKLAGLRRRIHTLNGDDGLVAAALELMGPRTRYYVEFGARDGVDDSMTKHLREDHGWTGLLMDCAFEDAAINLRKEFITAENIRGLFEKWNVPAGLDFLSVDIDGNDLWVLRALLPHYRPRLLAVETNQLLSPAEDFVVEYEADRPFEMHTCYYGASVLALAKVAWAHDYSLVAGVDQNAYFVAKEELAKLSGYLSHVDDVERLYLPRIPRCYVNRRTRQEREFPKREIEAMEPDLLLKDWEPLVQKALRRMPTLPGCWIPYAGAS
jgi:hypothetical protein